MKVYKKGGVGEKVGFCDVVVIDIVHVFLG